MTINPPPLGAEAIGALQSATSALHEELDRHLPLSAPDATLRDYADHLEHLHAWLTEFELPDADRRQHLLSLMASDLSKVSIAGRAPFAARMRSNSEPRTGSHTAAYRWGVAYVVEGSQLGGRVLYKRFAERFAPHPVNYLKGDADGGAAGVRWRGFVAELGAHLRTPEDIGLATRGAVDAFTWLLRSFGLEPPVSSAPR